MTDTGSNSRHWQDVYDTKAADTVSWFQAEPEASLAALTRAGASPTTSVIDVGGGASVLVDRLLASGWLDVSVLDIAGSALDVARSRLGEEAGKVSWIQADITHWAPKRRYDVWHDRAVFHFLTHPEQRAAYLAALDQALAPGGQVIMATFAPDGPERCSGLEIVRYDAKGLRAVFGEDYELVETWPEIHATPWGSNQSFTWCRLRRRA